MRVKGIDVSKHQKAIDWVRVKAAGIQFAMIRVGYRSYKDGIIKPDPYFKANIEGALQNGIAVGIYIFSTAISELEAVEEAEYVLDQIAPYQVTGPIVSDYEGYNEKKYRSYGTTKEQRTAYCKAFMRVIKEHGFSCMLYGSRGHIRSKYELSQFDDYLWVARYASNAKVLDDEKYFPNIPGYTDRIAIWQCADCGKVDGISGTVDIDYMYIDVFSRETVEEKEEVVKMIRPVDYKQTDKRWKSVKYAVDGEKSTIGSAGCGPTALADVLGAIVSPYIDPVTLAAWARYHNYKVKNQGTSYSFFVPCAAAYGVKVRRMNSTSVYGKTTHEVHKQVLAELLKGNMVIACMGKGLWTSSGHFIVAYGCENGLVYINDPASSKANRACNSWDVFKSQVKHYWVVEVPEHIKQNGIVTEGEYSQNDFVREVQFCTGATPDGKAGTETLSKTITVSKKKNRTHNVVLPLQKKLKKLGLYHDKLDRVAGNNFDTALKAFQTWMPKPDGEATARGKTWKKMLGLL